MRLREADPSLEEGLAQQNRVTGVRKMTPVIFSRAFRQGGETKHQPIIQHSLQFMSLSDESMYSKVLQIILPNIQCQMAWKICVAKEIKKLESDSGYGRFYLFINTLH